MSRVLLLLPTATYRAPDFLEAARRQGVDVVVASEEPSTMEALVPESLLTLDFEDPPGCASKVAGFNARFPIDALVAVDETTAVVAAAIGERLSLPHNSYAAARRARSKLEMRRALSAGGLAGPRFWRLTRERIARSDLDGDWSNAYPLVIKPIAMSGSRGVIRVDDANELEAAVTRAAAILEAADSEDRDLLIETFMPGDEYAVEGLLDVAPTGSGKTALTPLAIFDKPDPLDGPFFEETIYVTPSRLEPRVQKELLNATHRAAGAMGLRHGPVHAELRVHGDSIRIVEVAGRSIGGLCSRSLQFGLGVSLEEVILRHALGSPLPAERESGASGVMMLPTPCTGVLEAVEGQDEAKAIPGIVGVNITLTRGSRLVPLPEGSSYLGFVFAKAERPEDVVTALRRSSARLVVRTAQGESPVVSS